MTTSAVAPPQARLPGRHQRSQTGDVEASAIIWAQGGREHSSDEGYVAGMKMLHKRMTPEEFREAFEAMVKGGDPYFAEGFSNALIEYTNPVHTHKNIKPIEIEGFYTRLLRVAEQNTWTKFARRAGSHIGRVFGGLQKEEMMDVIDSLTNRHNMKGSPFEAEFAHRLFPNRFLDLPSDIQILIFGIANDRPRSEIGKAAMSLLQGRCHLLKCETITWLLDMVDIRSGLPLAQTARREIGANLALMRREGNLEVRAYINSNPNSSLAKALR